MNRFWLPWQQGEGSDSISENIRVWKQSSECKIFCAEFFNINVMDYSPDIDGPLSKNKMGNLLHDSYHLKN